jgi:hypothetical protein
VQPPGLTQPPHPRTALFIGSQVVFMGRLLRGPVRQALGQFPVLRVEEGPGQVGQVDGCCAGHSQFP